MTVPSPSPRQVEAPEARRKAADKLKAERDSAQVAKVEHREGDA